MRDQLRRRSVGAPAARSALLTVLGEYVLPYGGVVWQETLISALSALQYKPQAARQAIVRSVADGWLKSERKGRRSRVHLTEGTTGMLGSGTERIYSFGEPWEWDGRWLLVVLRVPEKRRDIRHRVRTRLAWAGFGSLGGGLWITPHAEREEELRELSSNSSIAEMYAFRAELGALGDTEKLIAEAWDLGRVGEAYHAFITDFGRLRPKTPESVFQAQTLLVHEWRKFPFLDPDLPESVLPARWPRDRALGVFRDRHAQWHTAAQGYFRSLESTSGAP
jgi:phenylacetic acid degradation operon negative regulatory protein